MKKLLAKIQKDISKLQKVVNKEGNDLLDKIKKLDLKTNIENTREELMKVLSGKIKKLEPTYKTFIEEIRKNAKKAGLELEKFEKTLKEKAKGAKKNFGSLKKKKTGKRSTGTGSKTGNKKRTRKTGVETV